MIQTKRTFGARRLSQAIGVIGVSRADFRLEAGHGDARIVGQQTRGRDAVAHFLQSG